MSSFSLFDDDTFKNADMNYIIRFFFRLAWAYSKYKALAPSLPPMNVGGGGTSTLSVKDELSKVTTVPVTAPVQENVTTKRPRRRRKKTTAAAKVPSSTVALTDDNDGSNDEPVLKPVIRAFVQ